MAMASHNSLSRAGRRLWLCRARTARVHCKEHALQTGCHVFRDMIYIALRRKVQSRECCAGHDVQCTPSAKYTMWLANATASDTVPHSHRHDFNSKWYSEQTTERGNCHEDSACPQAQQAACESARQRRGNILVRVLHSEMPARLVPKHTLYKVSTSRMA